MIPLAEYAILFSLWNVVGFVEISPGECQLDHLKNNHIYSLVIPCHENGSPPIGKDGLLPSTKYLKQ